MSQGLVSAVGRGSAVSGALARPLPLRLPWAGLYFSALFALAFTNGDVFLRKAGWLPLRPTLLFFLAALPLAAGVLLADLPRSRSRVLAALRDGAPLLLPLLALAGLAMAWALHPGANWSEGPKHALFPAYTFLSVLVAMVLGLSPAVAASFRPAVALSFLLLVGTIAVDVAAPGTFAKHMSRAAGLPEDPNGSAFLVVLAAALLLGGGKRRWVDPLVLALAGAAVLCTLSRGGLLLLLLVIVARALLPLARGEGLRRGHLLAGAGAAAALVLALAVGAWLASTELGIFGRVTTQERLELLASGTWVRSQEERLSFIGQYFDLIAEAPLAGHGTGFSYTLPQGPHNRFLFQWVNFGLAGLAVYLVWLIAAFRFFQLRRSDSGMLVVALVAAYSLLQHGVLEVRAVMLALGLLASLPTPAGRTAR